MTDKFEALEKAITEYVATLDPQGVVTAWVLSFETQELDLEDREVMWMSAHATGTATSPNTAKGLVTSTLQAMTSSAVMNVSFLDEEDDDD